jgi:hypothetical protein
MEDHSPRAWHPRYCKVEDAPELLRRKRPLEANRSSTCNEAGREKVPRLDKVCYKKN